MRHSLLLQAFVYVKDKEVIFMLFALLFSSWKLPIYIVNEYRHLKYHVAY